MILWDDWRVDPDHRQDRGSGPVVTYKLSPEEIQARYGDVKAPKGKAPIKGWDANRTKIIREREKKERVRMTERKVTKDKLLQLCREYGTNKGAHDKIAEILECSSHTVRCAISRYQVRKILESEGKEMVQKAVAEEKTESGVKQHQDDLRLTEKPKYERHMQLCQEINEQYRKKNEAYGDAFGKTFQKYGIISALTRMSDKWNRIEALIMGTDNKVVDEQLEDTLKDLACYCLMTIIEKELTSRGN